MMTIGTAARWPALTMLVFAAAGASQTGGGPRASIFGSQLEAIPEICDGGEPKPGNFSLVKVIVPKNYNPASTGRAALKIVFPKKTVQPDDPDETIDPNVPEEPEPVNLTRKPTKEPFHINIKGAKLDGRPWVKIKIIVKSDDYTFDVDPAYRDPDGLPLTYDNLFVASTKLAGPYPNTKFCRPRKNVTQNEDPTKRFPFASFFIKVSPNSGVEQRGSYSFRLIPGKFPETPIFVDPKIRNDG